MPEQMSAVFDQVMATCARGCFTGLLRVRAREGSGELRFLSGIQDGVRFGSMEGDAALERLQSASELEFEAISSLPPIDAGSEDAVPIEGRLEELHAAQLMRYCESNSLTCALELEVDGRVLTARYRLGELLSVEPDSEHTSRLAEAKQGRYRFRLPRFELPEHVRARGPASVKAAPAPAAPVSAAARAAAAPASRAAATPPSAARPAPVAAQPRGPAPRAVPQPGTPLKASPAIVVGAPSAATPLPPASTEVRPAASTPRANPAPASTREPLPAQAQRVVAAPPTPAVAAPAAVAAAAPAAARPAQPDAVPASKRPPLQDLWKDAVPPPSQAAPIELTPSMRPANDSRQAVVTARAKPLGADPRLGSTPELPQLPADDELRSSFRPSSSGRGWVWVLLILIAGAVAGWYALGRPMP